MLPTNPPTTIPRNAPGTANPSAGGKCRRPRPDAGTDPRPQDGTGEGESDEQPTHHAALAVLQFPIQELLDRALFGPSKLGEGAVGVGGDMAIISSNTKPKSLACCLLRLCLFSRLPAAAGSLGHQLNNVHSWGQGLGQRRGPFPGGPQFRLDECVQLRPLFRA